MYFFQVLYFPMYLRVMRGEFFTRCWRCSVTVCITYSLITESRYSLIYTHLLQCRILIRTSFISGNYLISFYHAHCYGCTVLFSSRSGGFLWNNKLWLFLFWTRERVCHQRKLNFPSIMRAYTKQIG